MVGKMRIINEWDWIDLDEQIALTQEKLAKCRAELRRLKRRKKRRKPIDVEEQLLLVNQKTNRDFSFSRFLVETQGGSNV